MSTRPQFDHDEDSLIEAHRPLSARQIFEIVRRNGDEELQRPALSLILSAFAAGLAMGLCVLSEASIAARLPDAEWTGLLADFGYCTGFLIVIFGRLQLYTESTITPVFPICYSPDPANLLRLLRFWSFVIAFNLLGCLFFAGFMVLGDAVNSDILAEMVAMGEKFRAMTALEIFTGGIGAGFIVAALVWILAHMRSGKVLTVILMTYIIAVAGFAHVIAGSLEMFILVLLGKLAAMDAVTGFFLPALAGNAIGGTVLFTLIAYGQIRDEL